jgi:hypothetical protein
VMEGSILLPRLEPWPEFRIHLRQPVVNGREFYPVRGHSSFSVC